METWDNDIKFIFTSLGCSIGFGAIWRFSYLLFNNGGGIFWVLTILFLMIIAIPYNYFEIAVGQSFRKKIIQLYKESNPRFWGIVFGVFNICFIFNINYVIILVYCLKYIIISLTNYDLPFGSLDPSKSLAISKNFFYNNIIKIEDINTDSFLGKMNYENLLLLFIIWTVIYFIIYKGINTSGFISIITVSLPYLILFILLINALFLEGISIGLKILLIPDFSKILNYKLWVASISQVSFQLSVGWQNNLMFSTMRKKNSKIAFASILIPIINYSTGFLSGIIIYMYLGYYSYHMNLDINNLPLSGPDLIFITIPSVLYSIHFSNFWVLLFFIGFILVAIDSIFSVAECSYLIVDNLFEEYLKLNFWIKLESKIRKLIFVFILFLLSSPFATSKGFYLFLMFDSLIFGYLAMLNAILLLIIFFFNKENINYLKSKVIEYNNEKMPVFFEFCLKRLLLPIFFVLFLLNIYSIIFDSDIYGIYKYWGWSVLLLNMVVFFFFYFKYKNYDIKNLEINKSEILLSKQNNKLN